MDKELLNTVTAYINASLEGQSVENPKIDFKRKWYKLNEDIGIYQFLKDTSAIANTVGLDGLIIIGFDEKTKEFFDSTFSDSGISDSEQLPGLIGKYIDRIFDINHFDITIDGHKLSVLQIPPSLEKPHVIRLYKTFDKGVVKNTEQHKVFVKRSTSTVPATKNDFELMYYDRKNIVPEYKIITNFHYPSLSYTATALYKGDKIYGSFIFNIPLTFENNGRRPVAITFFTLTLTEFEDPSSYEILNLDTSILYKGNPIVIHPNEISTKTIEFNCSELLMMEYDKAEKLIKNVLNGKRALATKVIELQLTNRQVLTSELTIV